MFKVRVSKNTNGSYTSTIISTFEYDTREKALDKFDRIDEGHIWLDEFQRLEDPTMIIDVMVYEPKKMRETCAYKSYELSNYERLKQSTAWMWGEA